MTKTCSPKRSGKRLSSSRLDRLEKLLDRRAPLARADHAAELIIELAEVADVQPKEVLATIKENARLIRAQMTAVMPRL